MLNGAGVAARLMITAMVLAAVTAVPAVQAQSAKPGARPIAFTISNQACFRGPGIDPYVQQAIAQRVRAARLGNAGELASFYVRVPSRLWRGLTVTGVGLHYESTSVYFREPVAVVRRVLQQAGVRVNANGNIPMTSEEAVEVQSLAATASESRAYGASGVTCGV